MMLKIGPLCLGAILAMIALATPAVAANQPAGLWRTPAMGGATIKFERCGAAVCGRIVSIDGETRAKPKLDENNPDPAKRTQRLVGKMFITGMSGGPKAWGSGRVYHPPSGKTVAATMNMIDPRTLELEACLMMMCRKSKLIRK